MASDHRPTPGALALLQQLERTPWRFGFLQTLRWLDSLRPERPPLGESVRPEDEPIRLGQDPSMIFAPSELAQLDRSQAGTAPRLLVHFFGLVGPQGPLPLHLTDYARDRLRNANDPTFARFLDLFHHRMLSLYYRAWAQAQPAVSLDRPDRHRFSIYLGALEGIGMPTLKARDAMPDPLKLHFTGHLANPSRHPEGLGAILSSYLRLPVRIEEFIGHWLRIPDVCYWRLGRSRDNGILGQSISLGGRVWDHQSKFRIRIGPVCQAAFDSLLPSGDSLKAVRAIVRNYVGDQLDWDLNPVLAEAEVKPVPLGGSGRLGWNTWLMSRPLGRDGHDLKLNPNLNPNLYHEP